MGRGRLSFGPRERQAFYDFVVLLGLCFITVFLIAGAVVLIRNGGDVTKHIVLVTIIAGSVTCALLAVLMIYAAVDARRSRQAVADADRLGTLLQSMTSGPAEEPVFSSPGGRLSTTSRPAQGSRDSSAGSR